LAWEVFVDWLVEEFVCVFLKEVFVDLVDVLVEVLYFEGSGVLFVACCLLLASLRLAHYKWQTQPKAKPCEVLRIEEVY
jgi:hypothetical protein